MSLKNILGQKQAVKILLNEIRTNNVKHSYVFYGVKGVGKKFTAIEFAKSLLCDKPNDGYSCDICSHCEKISNNSHPDVVVVDTDYQERLLGKMDKQKNIKIDTIRYIKEQAFLSPYFGKYKVFVIDQAETLQKEAANSLLKLLEEPPKNCVIILITASLGVLPKTVVSRCELIKFLPFTKEVLKNFFKDETNEVVFSSMEDIFYAKKVADLEMNLKNLSIYEIQNVAEELKKDKDLAKYFICKVINKSLSEGLKEEIYEFISDVETYLKEFRYNIDIGLLIETILFRMRAVLCSKNLL
jgi:DNA polymerase III delta' subunit